MRLWQKLWLLFTVIWVVVAALNAFTIFAFAEGAEQEKAVRPILLGVLVPPLAYFLGFLWERSRRKKPEG